VADPDFELMGGGGVVLLALPAILPSVISWDMLL